MDNKLSYKKLRELVCMADNLSEPLSYFFDMLDSGMLKGEIITESSREIDVIIKSTENAINDRLHLDIMTARFMLEQVVGEPIIHGVCFFTGGIGPLAILYVTDIKTAIVSLVYKGKPQLLRLVLSDKPPSYH